MARQDSYQQGLGTLPVCQHCFAPVQLYRLEYMQSWVTAGHNLQEWLAGTVTYNLGLCGTNGNACKTALDK